MTYLIGVVATVFMCWVWVGGYLADLVIWILSKVVPRSADETVVALVIGIAGVVTGILVAVSSNSAVGGVVTGVGLYIALRLPGKVRRRRALSDARAPLTTGFVAVPATALFPPAPASPAAAAPHVPAGQAIRTAPAVTDAPVPISAGQCPDCGDDAEPDDRFCGGCGRALAAFGAVAPSPVAATGGVASAVVAAPVVTRIGAAPAPVADPGVTVVSAAPVEAADPEVALVGAGPMPVAEPVVTRIGAPPQPEAGPAVTRIGPPPPPPLALRFDDGASVPLDDGVVLGRDPAPTSSLPQARLVALPDPGHSLSKTHAALKLDTAGAVWVCDLSSANGSAVTVDGDRVTCVPNEWLAVPVGATVLLGARSAVLTAGEET